MNQRVENPTVSRELEQMEAHALSLAFGPLYAVIRMFRDAYSVGKHNEFAKHCSAFSCVEEASLSLNSLEATKGPKPPPRTLH